MSEPLLCTSDDGRSQLGLHTGSQTVWLSQPENVELFQTTRTNVGLHVKGAIEDRALDKNSVVKEFLTAATDGKRHRTKGRPRMKIENFHPQMAQVFADDFCWASHPRSSVQSAGQLEKAASRDFAEKIGS